MTLLKYLMDGIVIVCTLCVLAGGILAKELLCFAATLLMCGSLSLHLIEWTASAGWTASAWIGIGLMCLAVVWVLAGRIRQGKEYTSLTAVLIAAEVQVFLLPDNLCCNAAGMLLALAGMTGICAAVYSLALHDPHSAAKFDCAFLAVWIIVLYAGSRWPGLYENGAVLISFALGMVMLSILLQSWTEWKIANNTRRAEDNILTSQENRDNTCEK